MPTPSAVLPSSVSLIGAAVASGTLDSGTAVLYRLYAFFGDPRLPEQYRGGWSDDDLAFDVARQQFDELPVETQALVLPFLVRPTSPRSNLSAQPTTALLAAAGPLTAQACVNGFVRQQVSPTIPVVVWGQCGGMAESAVVARVDEVVGFMQDLWSPMTTLMGPPIGDENVENDSYDDTPETGDGLLDIYLIDASVSAFGRSLTIPRTQTLAAALETPPFDGVSGASSTYIILAGSAGIELKATLAHEFFHSLQAAHNRTGTAWPTSNGWTRYWFVEASATWAEHEFVREASAGSTGVYNRFKGIFQKSGLPLSTSDNNNEYGSWAWPLFMRQEAGPGSIGAAWRAMEGKSGYNQLQAALDSQLSFAGHFRDFAVRSFNEDLEPGDPAQPRFQQVDSDFPLGVPDAPRAVYQNTVGPTIVAFPEQLPSLWSSYYGLVPAPGVHKMVFDFSSLMPADALDVDLLLLIKGRWERRAGVLNGDQEICDIEQAIVVLSNHDQKLNSQVSGTWEVEGKTSTCAPEAWRLVLDGPKPGAGTYTGVDESYCGYTPEAGWSGIVFLNPAGTGDILHISVGDDYFLISTRWAFDDPSDWGTHTFAQNNPRTVVQGDSTASPPRLIGDSYWSIPEPDVYAGDYHAHAEITCTTYDAP